MEIFLYYAAGFLWAVFTGFVFSTVGAAGGILASFGFITILGIHSANSVKVMSQILVIVSPLIALPVYLKQSRTKEVKKVLFYIAFIIAAGAVGGALFGSWFSKNYIYGLKAFKYLFGYLTFFVVGVMAYKMFLAKKKPDSLKSGEPCPPLRASFKSIDFTCQNKNYSVSPALLFFGGFLIAVLASIFGVGGGFLIVPFLTDGIGIPVFLAAGISMLVVLISSITSVSNYLRMGIHVVVLILLVELAGIIVGSRLGPKISKHLNDKALKYSLMVLLAFIGVYYVFKP